MAQREIFFDVEDVVLIPTECPKCDVAGEQRMCVMPIPGFKEIIMMAFRCEECGFENNDLKPTESSDMGRKYILTVTTPEDLERDVFQSVSGTIIVDKIGLEFTGGPNALKFTTVGNIIRGMVADLSAHSEDINALPDFLLQAGQLFTEDMMPYELVLSDPAGNSYIGKNEQNSNLTWHDYEKTEEERVRWG